MAKILAESLHEFREINKPVEELNEALPRLTVGGWLDLYLKDPNHKKALDRFKKAFEWQLRKLPDLVPLVDALSGEDLIKIAKSGRGHISKKPGMDKILIPYRKDLNGVLAIDPNIPVHAGVSTSARKGIHGGSSVKG